MKPIKRKSGGLLLLVLLLAFSSVLISSMPETATGLELDGKIDNEYYSGAATYYFVNLTWPEIADGWLYVIDNTSIDPDYVWVAWAVNKNYVDNTYGNGTVGFYRNSLNADKPGTHSFDDNLLESDGQQIQFYNCTGVCVFDAFFDLVDGPNGSGTSYNTNSTYGIPAWNQDGSDSVLTTGDGSLVEYNTSTVWNINYYYNTGSFDVLIDSPTKYGGVNYSLHPDYSDWEVRTIYEIRMNRTLFGGGNCSINATATKFLELHASPSKLGTVPTTELAPCIGDYVWEDLDRDGIQDPDEPGIANVTVELYNGTTDELINTAKTDADGFYKFRTNASGQLLTPGDYYIKFYNPNTSYYTGFSPQNQSTDDTVDSDVDPVTNMTAVTTLDANETDLSWDAGLMPVPELSTLVLFSVGLLTLMGYGAHGRRKKKDG